MSPLLLRVSGWLLFVGGLFMALTVFHLPTSPGVTTLILTLGGVPLILGIPALYARQAKQIGWVGLVGLVIIWLDIFVFPVRGAITGFIPTFKLPDSLLVIGYVIGALTLIGTLLFGITTIRAHIFPSWLGWIIFVGYIIIAIGNNLPDTFAPFIGKLGEWLFWLSLSAFGFVLLSERRGQEGGSGRSTTSTGARDTLPDGI